MKMSKSDIFPATMHAMGKYNVHFKILQWLDFPQKYDILVMW